MPHAVADRKNGKRFGRPFAVLGAGPAERLEPSARVRRAIALLVVSVLVPGTAQLLTGSQIVGRLIRRVWLSLLVTLVLFVLAWFFTRTLALWLATSPVLLMTVAVGSFSWAVAIALVVIDAWRLGRPDLLPIRARRWLAGGTVLLVLVTSYPFLALGGRAWAAADLIGGVFKGNHASVAAHGRYNVLLLGGDAGPDRIGTRPDSITLASIDAATGRTVLFGLPRNLENVPFPEGSPAAKAWPNGYSCGDSCLLNAVYTWASTNPNLFPGVADPGAEAMKEATEGITGLKVNYYVLIDLAGFEQLINAMGGITVTVREPVPIGGGTSRVSGYVQPGTHTLDGYRALWFARSRQGGSDYDRMSRQRCVMDAMLRQLDPQAVLVHFQQIAAASAKVVSTDIPARQLSGFIDLAVKAKAQPVRSVQFVPPLIVPARPDIALIQTRVAQAVASSTSSGDATTAAEPTTTVSPHMTVPDGQDSGTAPSGSETPEPGTGEPDEPSAGTSPSGPATSVPPAEGEDVGAICSPG